MMKIMTAMYTLRRGGAYDRFLMMLDAFLERDCEIHCLSLTPIKIEHSSFHNHVIYFPFKKMDGLIPKLVVLFIFPPWAIWVGWRNKIDLVIAFGFLYAFIQGFSKWSLKRPMVTLIRGSLTFGSKMQNLPKYFLYLNRSIENIGIRFSDRIITNNVTAREEILKRLGKGKNIDVQILYNNIPPMNIREPVDILQTRGKYGIPGDAKLLVTAGILNRGKNIETLISCLSKLEVKKVYVLIVGDASTKVDFRYKDYLKKLAEKLGVSEKVIFTGWLDKETLWRVFRSADLFLLPSRSEGMPNVMLEALGCDLPCLGSRIPGIEDILQYEELMFDPMDEQTIVNKVRKLFSDIQYFRKIKGLYQERKKAFIFDWKESIFQTVTKGIQSVTALI